MTAPALLTLSLLWLIFLHPAHSLTFALGWSWFELLPNSAGTHIIISPKYMHDLALCSKCVRDGSRRVCPALTWLRCQRCDSRSRLRLNSSFSNLKQ